MQKYNTVADVLIHALIFIHPISMNIYLYEYTYPRESNSRVTEPIHMQFYSFYPRETESIHMQFYSRETELIHVQFYTYTIINSTFERLNLQILEFYTYTILPLREHIQFYLWEWTCRFLNSIHIQFNLRETESAYSWDHSWDRWSHYMYFAVNGYIAYHLTKALRYIAYHLSEAYHVTEK